MVFEASEGAGPESKVSPLRAGRLPEELLGEVRQVLHPIAESRQLELDHPQGEVEIAAKAPCLDPLAEVGRRRGDDPRRDRDRPAAADSP